MLSKKMLVCFLMGFSSGLPLLLTLSTLQAWLKESGLELGQIGLFSLVGLPYAWKFIWAPLFDRFQFKIFKRDFLSRRRGWLFATQCTLILAIFGMGFCDPQQNLYLLASMACAVAFFSASQDIVIDSYRTEILEADELGLGNSVYVYGYRIAMLVAGAGALILADHYSWSAVFFFMAFFMLPSLLVTLWSEEPVNKEKRPTNFKESVIDPFIEFFTRDGAIYIFLFILLYKIGDTMASAMTTPFYLDLGFTKTEIGAVTKVFGTWATLVGTFIGGVLLLKWGLRRCLFLFGFLQGIAAIGFTVLANMGNSVPMLSLAICAENITGGMGTAAFVAYIATQTNKKFTATQYALLSSLMGIPRTILASPTGYLAKYLGWSNYFIFCVLVAFPGLIVLYVMNKKDNLKTSIA